MAWLAHTPFTPRADTAPASRLSPLTCRVALRGNFRLNENAGRVTYLQAVSTSTHNPESEAIRSRQRSALYSLLLTITCVAMAGFFWIPVSYYTDNGSIYVIVVEEIKLQAPSYSLLALAGFFFVRGIVIRFRPLSSTNTKE